MEELDNPATLEDFSKAIDCLAALKNGKLALFQPLHELFCFCWDQDHIPQDMRDANMVTVYKNKGDRSDHNSLLNIVDKAFARVTLVCLQILASCISVFFSHLHICCESQVPSGH